MDIGASDGLFSWMAWTPITAAFFAAIALTLVAYSTLGVLRPSLPRKGFLPMPTTRGDRLFVGLLGAAYINLVWAAASDASQWFAAAIWVPYLLVIARWG